MKINELKTQEIIERCIYAQREWHDEESKKKMLDISRKELKKRFDSLLDMLEDKPEYLIKDGYSLFKNILLKEY